MKFLFCCEELTLGFYPRILDTAFIGLEVQNPGPGSPKHIPQLFWSSGPHENIRVYCAN
jgi:hypothetical protein